MKKIIIILLLGVVFLTGCESKKEEKVEEKKDYSEYLFTNKTWIRDSGNDIETIRFSSEGGYSYYCACGNSVNDSDLCEGYTYDDNTKEIKLDCFETTDEMVTTIKIVNVNEDVLELDFNGEIRKFEIEK